LRERDRLAVEEDLLGAFDALAERRGLTRDEDAPLLDPTLDLPPRAEA